MEKYKYVVLLIVISSFLACKSTDNISDVKKMKILKAYKI